MFRVEGDGCWRAWPRFFPRVGSRKGWNVQKKRFAFEAQRSWSSEVTNALDMCYSTCYALWRSTCSAAFRLGNVRAEMRNQDETWTRPALEHDGSSLHGSARSTVPGQVPKKRQEPSSKSAGVSTLVKNRSKTSERTPLYSHSTS